MWLAARQGRKTLGMSFRALIGAIYLSSPSLNAQHPRGHASAPSLLHCILPTTPVFVRAFAPGCSAALP